MMGLSLLVICDLVLALIPAGVARGRGRPFGLWYAFGVILLPFALVACFLIKATPQAVRERAILLGWPQCPACGEYTAPGVACGSCGADLPPPVKMPPLTEAQGRIQRERLEELAETGEISPPAYRRAVYELNRRLER